jgi:hypothetical protein
VLLLLAPVPTAPIPVGVLDVDAFVWEGKVESCVAATGVGAEKAADIDRKLELALKESVS